MRENVIANNPIVRDAGVSGTREIEIQEHYVDEQRNLLRDKILLLGGKTEFARQRRRCGRLRRATQRSHRR